MKDGLTLGHVLIGFALVDLAAILMMVRSVRLARPDVPAERRRTLRIMAAAGTGVAVGICLIAWFHPVGQIKIA